MKIFSILATFINTVYCLSILNTQNPISQYVSTRSHVIYANGNTLYLVDSSTGTVLHSRTITETAGNILSIGKVGKSRFAITYMSKATPSCPTIHVFKIDANNQMNTIATSDPYDNSDVMFYGSNEPQMAFEAPNFIYVAASGPKLKQFRQILDGSDFVNYADLPPAPGLPLPPGPSSRTYATAMLYDNSTRFKDMIIVGSNNGLTMVVPNLPSVTVNTFINCTSFARPSASLQNYVIGSCNYMNSASRQAVVIQVDTLSITPGYAIPFANNIQSVACSLKFCFAHQVNNNGTSQSILVLDQYFTVQLPSTIDLSPYVQPNFQKPYPISLSEDMLYVQVGPRRIVKIDIGSMAGPLIVNVSPQMDIPSNFNSGPSTLTVTFGPSTLSITAPPSIFVGGRPCGSVTLISTNQYTCQAPSQAGSHIFVTASIQGQSEVLPHEVHYTPPSIDQLFPRSVSLNGGLIWLNVSNIGAFNDPVPSIYLNVGTYFLCQNARKITASFIACSIPRVFNCPTALMSITLVINGASTMSYPQFTIGQPIITSYAIGSSSFAKPVGGETVTIMGQEFGSTNCPVSLKVNGKTFPSASILNNRTVQATTVAGIGANLTIDLSLNYVSVLSPIFSYARPTIIGINGPDTPTEVGSTLIIAGLNFGNPVVSGIENVWLVPIDTQYSRVTCPQIIHNADSIIECVLDQPLEDTSYYPVVRVGGQSSLETTRVYRNLVPNRPSFCSKLNVTTSENVDLLITLLGSDADGDPIDYTIESSPIKGKLYYYASSPSGIRGSEIPGSPIKLVGNQIVYSPALNWNGNDVFSYTVGGRIGITNQSMPCSVGITIKAVNQIPQPLSPILSNVLLEDGNATISLQVVDPDDSLFTFSIISFTGKGSLFIPSSKSIIQRFPFTFRGLQPSVDVLFVPEPHGNGDDYATFTWQASDASNATFDKPASVSISVTPVNDLPTIYSDSVSTLENQDLIIRLTGVDIENDVITFRIMTRPKHGELFQYNDQLGRPDFTKQITPNIDVESTLGYVVYRPNNLYYGNDSFAFIGYDGAGVTSQNTRATVFINIQFVNQKPVLVDLNQTVTIPGDDVIIPFTISIRDDDETDGISLYIDEDPKRGTWYTSANVPEVIQKNSMKQMTQDVKNEWRLRMAVKTNDDGASVPYTNLVYYAKDSYNATTIKGTISFILNCPINQFPQIWKSTGRACGDCPDGGICSSNGEFMPVNREGYYPSKDQVIFLACTPPQACPSGVSSNMTSYSCATGYAGDRCGQCEKKYYRQGQICEKCPEQISLAGMIIIALILLIVVMFLVNMLRKIDLGFVSILITFLQTLAIYKNVDLNWSKEILQMFHIVSFLNLNIEIASPECFMDDVDQAYENKWVMMMLFPPMLIGVSIFLIICERIQKRFFPNLPSIIRSKLGLKASEDDQQPFYATIVSTYFLIMKLSYLMLTRKSLEIFDCTRQADGNRYFDAEPNRRCGPSEAWWMRLLPGSILGIVFYIVGIPAFIALMHYGRRKYQDIPLKNQTNFQKIVLEITYIKKKEFNDGLEYWDVVLLVRKLLVIVCQLLFSGLDAIQGALIVIVFQIFVLYHNQKKPYVIPTLNSLEVTTLFSSTVILICGILFAVSRSSTDIIARALTITVVTVTVICITSVLFSMFKHFGYLLAAKKLVRKSLENLAGNDGETKIINNNEREIKKTTVLHETHV